MVELEERIRLIEKRQQEIVRLLGLVSSFARGTVAPQAPFAHPSGDLFDQALDSLRRSFKLPE